MCGLFAILLLLTFSAHALEGYSISHFVCLSVCLSVADLEDGGLLEPQRI